MFAAVLLCTAGAVGASRPAHPAHTVRITSPVVWVMTYTRSYTEVQRLVVEQLPASARVAVRCSGAGCPFRSRRFSPPRRTLSLTFLFKASKLGPGSTVRVEITAGADIGKVLVFTMRSDQPPRLAERCLAPGSSTPIAC